MEGIVEAGGYDKKRDWIRLATPRASSRKNVYELSVDVFVSETFTD